MRNLFDTAGKLEQAAKDNDPDACSEYFGKAKSGNIFVNSKALRIAAENKSYEAFERMLEISGKDACGISSEYSFALGKDLDTVYELAETDERLCAALAHYEEQIDEGIDSIVTLPNNLQFFL